MRAVIFDWGKMDGDTRYTLYGFDSERQDQALRKALAAGTYHVYEVEEAATPDELFEILNIAHPRWYKDRSMSCGDIAIEEDGVAWVCEPFGWKSLGKIPIEVR